MKTLFISILVFCALHNFGQNQVDTLANLINTYCIGSPAERQTQRQAILCSSAANNGFQLEAITTELKTHRLLRENKYYFQIKDIDWSNVEIKQFGQYYGLFLHTKGGAKTIQQYVKLANDQEGRVLTQDKMCISDFETKEIAERIKKEFEKLILAAGTPD